MIYNISIYVNIICYYIILTMLLEEHMFGPLEQAAEKQPTNQPIFLNVYSILNYLPKKKNTLFL